MIVCHPSGGGDITEAPKIYYGLLLRLYYGILRILRVFYYGYYGQFFNLNELRGKAEKFENSPNSFRTSPNMVKLNLLHVEEHFEHKHAHIPTTFLNFHLFGSVLDGQGCPLKALCITDITEYYGYYGKFLLRTYYGYYGAVISPPPCRGATPGRPAVAY